MDLLSHTERTRGLIRMEMQRSSIAILYSNRILYPFPTVAGRGLGVGTAINFNRDSSAPA
jgi:hypothetical protein